jgi:hypothetical protein
MAHSRLQTSARPTTKPTRRQTPGRDPGAYRERRKSAGKVLRVIDTWAEMTPAEIAELRLRLDSALLALRQQDVARLEARTVYLEAELTGVERNHTNALKDNVVLKKQLAERPKRRARQAEASPP